MGDGRYDDRGHAAREEAYKRAGYSSAFRHTEDIRAGRRTAGTNERLRPGNTNANGPHAGQNIREAMDSDEHPNSTPIMVFFDVTGSMGGVPRVLQQKLPKLLGTLQERRYCPDPQICFGAVGDAYSDTSPLQVGQFESDNRMDDDIAAIFLEGGGGGGNHESYDLALYFAAHHTYTDAWAKRHKKGYVFLVGDERAYRNVNEDHVRRVIGGKSANWSGPLTTQAVAAQAMERYHVFYLFAEDGPSYRAAESVEGRYRSIPPAEAVGWRDVLGQNAVILKRSDAVCEAIGTIIGVTEGNVTVGGAIDDLRDMGADLDVIGAANGAVAQLTAGV